MTMTPEVQAEIDRQVQQRLAAAQPVQQPVQQFAPQQFAPQGFAPQGFAQPQQQFMQPAGGMAAPTPQAVLVPIEIAGPDGRQVTLQLQFGAQFAANPQALAGLVAGLMAQGYPVRAFAPKQQGWGGGGGGGWRNNGGGGGGGYGRRY